MKDCIKAISTKASSLSALVLSAVALMACSNGGSDSSKSAPNAGMFGDLFGASGTYSSNAGERSKAAADGWVAVNEPNDVLMQGLNIPANAPTKGMWSEIGPWPMNGLHQALLPDGKILSWGMLPQVGGHNGRYFDVWDPNKGLTDPAAHQATRDDNYQDSFCAPSVYLPDGRLMITGGNGATTSQIYTPANAAMVKGANTADARWYATMLTLADGRHIVLGGIDPYTEGQWTDPNLAINKGYSSMTPEVYENGAWRSLLNAKNRDAFGPDFLRASLPKAWLAPDGRVFGVGTDNMWYVDPEAGNRQGETTIVGQYKPAPNAGANNDTADNVGPTGSAVMYAPGKVMFVGGNSYQNGSYNYSSKKATLIDINNGGAVKAETAPMANPRQFANMIVLPDGKVLVTGGETKAHNLPQYGVYAAEQWNPANGTWTTLASAGVFRGYHSQTSLLTNGAVISAGGGEPGPIQEKGEVFYPPYLFRTVNGAAQLAPRPKIVGISGQKFANGGQVQLDMANGDTISQVALIGISVGTHGFNSGQRRIPLNFTQNSIRLTTSIPENKLVPPGYYQVVALDANGVPSRGSIIAIGQDVIAPNGPVTPYNPPILDAAINAPIIASGATASYTLPTLSGVTYSWNFGDGSPVTGFVANPNTTHVFAKAGVYTVILTAKAQDGSTSTRSFLQAVAAPIVNGKASVSSAIALESRANASARVWVANPDTDTVSVIDTANNARVAEIAVGVSPRTVAVAPDGRIWVTNKGSSSISIISAANLTVAATINLPRASQPHGLAFANGGSAFVALEATGVLLKLDPASGATKATLPVGPNPRGVSTTMDGGIVLVSRFISNALPAESTAKVTVDAAGGEVLAVNADAMTLNKTINLRNSDKADNEIQGAGLPNYLGAAAISPDGKSAWLPSKQDNITRGMLRNGQQLNFQNTVRAISSRIDLGTLAEDYGRRVDHDNSSLSSAALFHTSGAYMFVALETSRQIALVDAANGRELGKFEVGRAPQGLAVSSDGSKLFVQNFMDRTVSVLDLNPLITQGLLNLPQIANVKTIATEKLAANVLLGKQHFYDARDPRLARDSYLSCASCHNDGGSDGRVWDFTGVGEGLRSTPSLKGRAGLGHGFMHWSANFDEVQDFEGQIRALAGGTGLMTDAQFNTGTRNTPLGDKKAGVSADLDALAAYVSSLNTFDNSPYRNADGSMTNEAVAGKTVFANAKCADCHAGAGFTLSADASTLKDIGTMKAASGKRLGGTLPGIDTPSLRDAWKSRVFLHDGSALNLQAAIQAHNNAKIAAADMNNLVAYLQQIGNEETGPSLPPGLLPAGALAIWDFDTATATTAPDTSGNNRTLTLGTGTSLLVNGLSGKSLQVAGPDSPEPANTNDKLVDTTGSFAVSAWVRFDKLPDCYWQAVASQDGTNLSGFYLGIDAACNNNPAKFRFSMNSVDANDAIVYGAYSNKALAINTWYHLVGVRDATSGNVTLYVDGVAAQTSATANAKWAANGKFAVGRAKFYAASRDQLYGAIDAVRVYGRVLSAAEVTALYQARGASSGTTPPANKAPTVNLTAPANNVSVAEGNAITITASAADSDGSIAKVEFFDGNTLLATVDAAPYSYSWSGAAVGNHSLTARATDNSGASTTSAAIAVTVTAATTANKAPTVNITGPGDNTSVVQGNAITITASAADSDGTISKVEFLDGNTLIATVNAAPYSYKWNNAAVGTHSITARATDNKGAATTSAAITVKVTAAPAANKAPTINITAPGDNAVVNRNTAVTISANAADSDGTITKVEFFDGAYLLGTVTAAPYTFSWSTAVTGTHTITARATDNTGATTTSAPITLIVKTCYFGGVCK